MELGTQCVVEMEGQQTILQYPQSAHEKIERLKILKWLKSRAAPFAVTSFRSCARTAVERRVVTREYEIRRPCHLILLLYILLRYEVILPAN
ncbi:hypothetical protein EVAR_103610_1 [Eumeta japonica]|uniref:Uncharacterized protein n=1 Tax=Eumeta variegata TaxID=151549 RepID=A0A4C1Z9C1_EUMVA|nr:hypothetical protein EVAR_103610_1 [Eumeta japonica]